MSITRSSCLRADSVMDSQTTGPGFKAGYGTLSIELLTDYHHTSITKLSVCWGVWKVLEAFPDQV